MLRPGEVRIRKSAHPRYKWECSFVLEGRRKVRYFNRKVDAEDFAEDWGKDVEASGSEKRLTEDERSAVFESRDDLKGVGISLREAIKFAVDHQRKNRRVGDVETLVEERLETLEHEGASYSHLKNTRGRLKAFAHDFRERTVASISPEEISDWLVGLKRAARTMHNYRAALSALFNEGLRRRYCDSNPVEGALKPRPKHEGEIGVLTPAQAARLLKCAGEAILPSIAIGMFAGLRDSEIKLLDWSAADLKRGYIRVPSNSKTGKRLVPIQPNLKEWLAPFAQNSERVWPPNGRKLHEDARSEAGFDDEKPWPHNALRHSYASYHLAKFQDIGMLAEELGNSADVIRKHYRELVYPEDADDYWGITPKDHRPLTTNHGAQPPSSS